MAANLSDSELFRKLQALGVDVGPINDTTRNVYLRKYVSLLSKKGEPDEPPPTTPVQDPNQKPKEIPTTPPLPHPTTPPSPHVTSPPLTSPSFVTPSTTQPSDGSGEAVVTQLLQSFDNPNHIASDTAFLFPDGEVLLASRSILATQCNKMIPMLYNNEVPYLVRVVTLSGQVFELMARGGELVRDLKQKISMVHDIAPVEQRLVFMEQELQDSRTLSSYQIFSGATLHLVLVAAAMNSAGLSYSCPAVAPTLSIYHFSTGLNLEQLSPPSQTPPLLQRVPLPAHLTHVVHVYDRVYSGFKLFLQYLYCRKLQNMERSSVQWSSYLMSYILGELFQVPCLVQTALSVIASCLDEKLAHAILDFSKNIQSPSLEQVCLNFIKEHPSI